MILDRIVELRRQDVAEARAHVSIADLERTELYAQPRRGFRAALAGRSRAIIAEVKKASPSKGVIRADFDPVAIARGYEGAGAAAISVLTEERHFQGRPEFLVAVRAATSLPLLRKDFLFDPYQVHEARAWGADAVLLIVSVLGDAELHDLRQVAEGLGLDVLVEVHDRAELDRAHASGATLIGVNNRDLRTFVTTLETTEALAVARMPGDLLVSESGINKREDIERLEKIGVTAFLIGESLMRAADPGDKLRELLAEPSPR